MAGIEPLSLAIDSIPTLRHMLRSIGIDPTHSGKHPRPHIGLNRVHVSDPDQMGNFDRIE